MDLKNVLNSQKEKMVWGSAIALWDTCRYKVAGIPLLDIFVYQAKDLELKRFIEDVINNVTLPHIKKIQGFFQKEGLTAPQVPQRKNLESILGHIEPNAFISDEQIARSLREMLRFGIDVGSRGLIEATRKDVRDLIWEIFSDDSKTSSKLVDLKEKKNWVLKPPSV